MAGRSAPFELTIGRRYLRSTGNRFLSFISLISMVGVAIGVAVLIVVLSVMNGFEHELRSRILSLTSHATVTAFGEGLVGWEAMRDTALANPRVSAAAPFVEAETLLIADRAAGASSAATLARHRPGARSAGLGAGRAADERLDAVAAAGLVHRPARRRTGAASSACGLGDAVVVAVAKGNVTPAGVLPRLRRFKVAGIFRSGMYEIDATLAVVHVADAARLLRLGDNVTGLRLAVKDPYEAPLAAREVANELGGGLYVEDWTQRNANFFRSIELTKRMMFFILLLVVAVAAFNIVSTLVMAVKDKQPDIAILRTIGARPSSILAIFTTQGTVIGLLGTLAGVALGVLLSLNLESIVHGLERLLRRRSSWTRASTS